MYNAKIIMQNFFLYNVVVGLAGIVIVDDLLKGITVEIFRNDTFKPLPNRQSYTLLGAVAKIGVMLKAGNRCKPSFGQPQNFSDGIFVGRAGETIASLIASACYEKVV